MYKLLILFKVQRQIYEKTIINGCYSVNIQGGGHSNDSYCEHEKVK